MSQKRRFVREARPGVGRVWTPKPVKSPQNSFLIPASQKIAETPESSSAEIKGFRS
jgi:hypothetical protein